MMRSLFAGVSGLRNHQTRMDVIGNNIANVNTIGFKASRVQFQDVLSQTLQGAAAAQGSRGGTNPMQVGLGMGLASIDTIFTDGSFQPTGKQTDLSIQGQGFFTLQDQTGSKVYTRAGNFDFDNTGNYLVPGTGYRVMGWMATTGTINTAGPVTSIQIPIGSTMAASASTQIEYANILAADAAIGASTRTSIPVYDSLGNAHSVDQTFIKTGPNKWMVYSSVPDAQAAPAPTGTRDEITFTSSGTVSSITGATPTVIPTATIAATAISLDSTLSSVGTTTFNAFDSNGQPHVFTMEFSNTGAGTWNYKVYDGPISTGAVPVTTGTATLGANLVFAPNNFSFGSPASTLTLANIAAAGVTQAAGGATGITYPANYTTPAVVDLAFTPTGGAAAMTVNLALSTLTQYGNSGVSTVQATNQNGYAAGTLQNTSIDPSGIIVGRFSNGQSQNLAQVALATFNNAAGLNKVGDNLFGESNNSGVAQIGTSSTGGRGKFSPGTLEMSNVDLAQEFSNMIITQRGFQANSKIISTDDEMLQELANLKR